MYTLTIQYVCICKYARGRNKKRKEQELQKEQGRRECIWPFCLVHFQVTRAPRCIHHTEPDWADLQACPTDLRASCSLSASYNTAGITQTGEVWEPTRGVHPGQSRDGGVWDVGGEQRVERVFREGAEDPLFNFTRSFQMREKAESGVLCHPATQGPLKSSLSGFSSEVSSQETKKRRRMTGRRI